MEQKLISSAPEDDELLQTLEKKRSIDGVEWLCQYKNVWYPVKFFRPYLSIQKHFKAKDTDIILSTMPKSGTTWLRALTFCIANRNSYPINQNPLLTVDIQELVPILEINTYLRHENPNLENIPCPRIFATHLLYKELPDSVHETKCRIIYLCRNPLDMFNSFMHFLRNNVSAEDAVNLFSMDEAVETFCNGIHPFGPFWDQILEHWELSIEKTDKVLFLKYEDMKEDIVSNIKKIAEFVGIPIEPHEEKEGVVDEIARLCSFEGLKNLEANKSGETVAGRRNDSYFRKGEVGDWANHLDSSMAQRIEKVTEMKLRGSGLTFEKYCK